jgi:hypothetical protein
MHNKHKTSVKIVEQRDKAKLSRAQKLFNKLIKDIEQQSAILREWQDVAPVISQLIGEQFEPAEKALNLKRAELAQFFDVLVRTSKLTKVEKKKLSSFISDITESVIDQIEDTALRDSLKALYNDYSGGDYDEEAADEKESMKEMMEMMLGVEIEDDFDFQNPEQMIQQMQKAITGNLANEEDDIFASHTQAPKKKSAKAIAKEEKLAQEAKNVNLSLREVYRKLASALHPDREPDSAERERKTQLMKRVNVAYEKKDLLALLQLQLEIEQIDTHTLNNLSEERVAHFNQILREQVQELQQEIEGRSFIFRMQMDIPSYVPLQPSMVLEQLKRDIQNLQTDLAMIANDIALFADINEVKQMLKTYRIPKKQTIPKNPFDEDDFYF